MRKRGLFYIFFALFLCSCNQQKALLFTEKEITTEENSIVFINIPQVEGETQIANKINSSIRQVIGKSLSVKENNTAVITTLEEQINSFNEEYKNFKKDFPDMPVIWEAQVDGEILYQSEEIVTVALTIYTNTGGAHGISSISLLNFNPETGSQISVAELFSDFTSFQNIAKSAIKKEVEANKEKYFDSDKINMPENIGFTEDGILMLYNVYEISPYASGITEVIIPFDAVDDYLNYY